MNPWLSVIVVAVEIGLVAVAAYYAHRAQCHAIDARYEAEYARRYSVGARRAARYAHEAAAHLEAHAGVPMPMSLRAAWEASGAGTVRYPGEEDSKTPA